MSHFHSLKPHRILELGPAYAASSVNTVIFRYHAIVTRHFLVTEERKPYPVWIVEWQF